MPAPHPCRYRRPARQMNTGCQHSRPSLRKFSTSTKRLSSRLMVYSKSLHDYSPCPKYGRGVSQLFKVEGLKGPLLSSYIVREMMEIKAIDDSDDLVPCKGCNFNRRSTHFTNRHNGIILPKVRWLHHTQIVMHDWLIGIRLACPPALDSRQPHLFDDIDDIKRNQLSSHKNSPP